jgi:choline dehydrogenase
MFDYIIVGSGPAGCVVANRLTEDPAVSVLLLEAGGSDRSPIVQMPAAVPFAYMSKRLGWGFESGPEPYLDGKVIDEKRGRVLGGSSSINAMIFNRGNPQDYDGWAQRGLPEWSWDRCLPYFKKMESFAGEKSPWRGDRGPLRISRCKADFPLYQDFLRAGEQAGYGITLDHNGARQEGFHVAQAYIQDGVRSSAANAYLRPAEHRANLTVRTGALVTRVLLEGTRAAGVLLDGGERLECRREVVLAAGAFGSPQLLMLSGLGNPDHLRDHGIEVRVELPAVGEHLENHPGVNLQFITDAKHSMVSRLGPIGRVRLGAEWLLRRRGLGTTNFFETGAFLRTRDDTAVPNMQFEFLPLVRYIEKGKLKATAGFNFWMDLSRPASRGRVALRSADPKAAPSIVFNHLAEAVDLSDLVDGVLLGRSIVRQGALATICKSETMPGPTVRSRAELAGWIRANIGTSYHPSGTCRMGKGSDSVVGPEGLVHGTSGLRIVDASIMPSTVTANISAAVYMMAEKIADQMRTPTAARNQTCGLERIALNR